MAIPRILLVFLAVAIVPPAEAAVLYKSVGANGVIEFSDQPPAGNAKVIEQRELGAAASSAPATPDNAMRSGRIPAMEALANDDEVMRASAQVDLAEHALALARRGVWSPTEGLRLQRISRTTSDEERIEYYRHGVQLARQNLLDVMKRRAVVLAAPGMPIVTAVASR